MKLCDRCGVPIVGTAVVVVLSTGHDVVCHPCWLGFLHHYEEQMEDD